MNFPNDFLWGSATSAHQVEGNNKYNDWWHWEEMGRARERSLSACDHYNLFEQDFNIAKSLNQNAHRFSVEWSRIEPKEGQWSESEIQHYRKVITALKSRDIEPVVTLHHFTLPLWVSEKGGFLSRETAGLFERYVIKLAVELGENIRYWITINEPFVLATLGYLEGKWPPQERSFPKTVAVIRNLLLSHAKAYRAIHGVYKRKGWPKPDVSMAKNIFVFKPCRKDSYPDRLAKHMRNKFYNHLYFTAVKTGWLFFPGIFCEYHPEVKGTLDFLGINYYTRHFIRSAGWGFPHIFGAVCMAEHHTEAEGKNTLGWGIHSQGIFDIALEYYKLYNLPIIITENGTSVENDEKRWEFIKGHLLNLGEAIKKGALVKGYFYWSLLDNFEWADGYGPRFGLVEVDYKTKERRVRESARKYAQVCKDGALR